jgi:hypothetical protein
MLQFHADKFVALTAIMATVSLHFRFSANEKPDQVELDMLKEQLPKVRDLAAAVGLTLTAKKAVLVLGHTNFAGYDKRHYAVSLDEIKERLRDELEGRFCLALNANEAALYAPTQSLIGKEVEDKFPSLLYDIDESLKCGALGRDTASAFHAIRCLESGIVAIARCLGIPDPTKGAERNWGAVLGKIKSAYEAKWPTVNARFTGDGKLFEELHGTLHAMQNPYRNATMHLDSKYAPGEAEMIRIFVREFLRKVAARMDENGLPKA